MAAVVFIVLMLCMVFLRPLRYGLLGIVLGGLPYLLGAYLGLDLPPQLVFVGALCGIMLGIVLEMSSVIPEKE